MYCKLKYVVIYLKLLTNFVILRSFGNLKEEETKKGFCKLTRNSLFKLESEKTKKSLYKPARENLFKSKIENYFMTQ